MGAVRATLWGLAILLSSGVFSWAAYKDTVSGIKALIRRKDIYSLPAAVKEYYSAPSQTYPSRTSPLLVVSCLRALNEKKTRRVLKHGVELLSSLMTAKVPRDEILLGVIALEVMAIQAGEASILPEFAKDLHFVQPLSESLPHREQFLKQCSDIVWIPWEHMNQLRVGLLQFPSETSVVDNRRSSQVALALGMVSAFSKDLQTELRVLRAIELLSSDPDLLHTTTSFTIAEAIASAAAVGAALTEQQCLDASAQILDRLCDSAHCHQHSNSNHALDFVLGRTQMSHGLNVKQLSTSWIQCRSESVLQEALYAAQLNKGPFPISKIVLTAGGVNATAEPCPSLNVLCLGDGDFSSSVRIAASAPASSVVVATSILTKEAFAKLYKSRGADNLEALVKTTPPAAASAAASAVAVFEVDATDPSAWERCLGALAAASDCCESTSFDVIVFNFPFADQKQATSTSNEGSTQFDTHYLAVGRHRELLRGVFRCWSTAVLPLSKCSSSSSNPSPRKQYLVFSLLLHQALAWEAERIAAEFSFRLSRVQRLEVGSYGVRRSNVDSSFPVSNSGTEAWSFEFCLA